MHPVLGGGADPVTRSTADPNTAHLRQQQVDGCGHPSEALSHTFLNMSSATLATEGLPAAITTATVTVWAIVILRQAQTLEGGSGKETPGPLASGWAAGSTRRHREDDHYSRSPDPD
jgi:hypothetical protein